MSALCINKGIHKLGGIFSFFYTMNSNYVLRIPLPFRLVMYSSDNSSSSSGGHSSVDSKDLSVAKAMGVLRWGHFSFVARFSMLSRDAEVGIILAERRAIDNICHE